MTVSPRQITTTSVAVTGENTPLTITATLVTAQGTPAATAATADGQAVAQRANTFASDADGNITLNLIPTTSIQPEGLFWQLLWPDAQQPLRISFGPGDPVDLADLVGNDINDQLIPPGGSQGQHLAKSSSADWDVEWDDPPPTAEAWAQAGDSDAIPDAKIGNEIVRVSQIKDTLYTADILHTDSGSVWKHDGTVSVAWRSTSIDYKDLPGDSIIMRIRATSGDVDLGLTVIDKLELDALTAGSAGDSSATSGTYIGLGPPGARVGRLGRSAANILLWSFITDSTVEDLAATFWGSRQVTGFITDYVDSQTTNVVTRDTVYPPAKAILKGSDSITVKADDDTETLTLSVTEGADLPTGYASELILQRNKADDGWDWVNLPQPRTLSDTAPGNTPGSASAGTSKDVSRADHDHGAAEFTPSKTNVYDSVKAILDTAANTVVTVSGDDSNHELDLGIGAAKVTSSMLGSAAVTSAKIKTGAVGGNALADSQTMPTITATDGGKLLRAKSDRSGWELAPIPTVPDKGTATPKVESGSGSAGTGAKWSPEDHVHPARTLPTPPPAVEANPSTAGTEELVKLGITPSGGSQTVYALPSGLGQSNIGLTEIWNTDITTATTPKKFVATTENVSSLTDWFYLHMSGSGSDERYMLAKLSDVVALTAASAGDDATSANSVVFNDVLADATASGGYYQKNALSFTAVTSDVVVAANNSWSVQIQEKVYDAGIVPGIDFWSIYNGYLYLDVDTTANYDISFETTHSITLDGTTTSFVSRRSVTERIQQNADFTLPLSIFSSVSNVMPGSFTDANGKTVNITRAMIEAASTITQKLVVKHANNKTFTLEAASMVNGQANFLQYGPGTGEIFLGKASDGTILIGSNRTGLALNVAAYKGNMVTGQFVPSQANIYPSVKGILTQIRSADISVAAIDASHGIGLTIRADSVGRTNLETDQQMPASFGTAGQVLTVNSGADGAVWSDTSETFTPSKANLYSSVKAILDTTTNTVVTVSGDDTNNELDLGIGAGKITKTMLASGVIPVKGTATPLVESGSGVAGKAASWSPEDHVHPIRTLGRKDLPSSQQMPSSLGTAGQVLAINSAADATEWKDASGSSFTPSQANLYASVKAILSHSGQTVVTVTGDDTNNELDLGIGSGKVTSSMLSSNSVTAAKILNDQVTASKLIPLQRFPLPSAGDEGKIVAVNSDRSGWELKTAASGGAPTQSNVYPIIKDIFKSATDTSTVEGVGYTDDDTAETTSLSIKREIIGEDWGNLPVGFAFSIGRVVVRSGFWYICIKAHTKGGTGPDNDSTNWEALTDWTGAYNGARWYHAGQAALLSSGKVAVAKVDLAPNTTEPAVTDAKWFVGGNSIAANKALSGSEANLTSLEVDGTLYSLNVSEESAISLELIGQNFGIGRTWGNVSKLHQGLPSGNVTKADLDDAMIFEFSYSTGGSAQTTYTTDVIRKFLIPSIKGEDSDPTDLSTVTNILLPGIGNSRTTNAYLSIYFKQASDDATGDAAVLRVYIDSRDVSGTTLDVYNLKGVKGEKGDPGPAYTPAADTIYPIVKPMIKAGDNVKITPDDTDRSLAIGVRLPDEAAPRVYALDSRDVRTVAPPYSYNIITEGFTLVPGQKHGEPGPVSFHGYNSAKPGFARDTSNARNNANGVDFTNATAGTTDRVIHISSEVTLANERQYSSAETLTMRVYTAGYLKPKQGQADGQLTFTKVFNFTGGYQDAFHFDFDLTFSAAPRAGEHDWWWCDYQWATGSGEVVAGIIQAVKHTASLPALGSIPKQSFTHRGTQDLDEIQDWIPRELVPQMSSVSRVATYTVGTPDNTGTNAPNESDKSDALLPTVDSTTPFLRASQDLSRLKLHFAGAAQSGGGDVYLCSRIQGFPPTVLGNTSVTSNWTIDYTAQGVMSLQDFYLLDPSGAGMGAPTATWDANPGGPKINNVIDGIFHTAHLTAGINFTPVVTNEISIDDDGLTNAAEAGLLHVMRLISGNTVAEIPLRGVPRPVPFGSGNSKRRVIGSGRVKIDSGGTGGNNTLVWVDCYRDIHGLHFTIRGSSGATQQCYISGAEIEYAVYKT